MLLIQRILFINPLLGFFRGRTVYTCNTERNTLCPVPVGFFLTLLNDYTVRCLNYLEYFNPIETRPYIILSSEPQKDTKLPITCNFKINTKIYTLHVFLSW